MYTPQHCLDVSARYETYGQLGEPSLRGLDNTAIAPDLLHTIIDLTMTIVKWLVCCTEGCGTDSGSMPCGLIYDIKWLPDGSWDKDKARLLLKAHPWNMRKSSGKIDSRLQNR